MRITMRLTLLACAALAAGTPADGQAQDRSQMSFFIPSANPGRGGHRGGLDDQEPCIVLRHVHDPHDADGLARAGEGCADDALPMHLADVLIEVPNRRASIDGDLAGIGFLLSHDETEDGALAGAIGPEQAHLLAAKQRERGIHEQHLTAMLLANGIETNHAA